MKISIIVPIHNLEPYLHNSLSRIISLYVINEIETELICILDNCTDGSWKEVQKIQQCSKIMPVKIIECNVGSAGLARNIGLDNANGDWIWFIDGDDYIINPEALLYFNDVLTKNQNVGIINFNFLFSEKICDLYANGGSMFCNVWSRIFSRELIGDTRFNDKQVAEDLDFVNEVFSRIDKEHGLFHINRLLYFYNNLRIDSLTNLNNSKQQ